LSYEVFAGNIHGSRTWQAIVATREARHGQGMASAANLARLRDNGRRNIIGAPKSGLKKFGAELPVQTAGAPCTRAARSSWRAICCPRTSGIPSPVLSAPYRFIGISRLGHRYPLGNLGVKLRSASLHALVAHNLITLGFEALALTLVPSSAADRASPSRPSRTVAGFACTAHPMPFKCRLRNSETVRESSASTPRISNEIYALATRPGNRREESMPQQPD
jgi:hypothetical protein